MLCPKCGLSRCYFILWHNSALEKQVIYEYLGANGGGNGTPSREFYLQPGMSYSTIGSKFTVRTRKYRSIFDISGASIFPNEIPKTLPLLNSKTTEQILQALNPTINTQSSDVKGSLSSQ